MNCLFFRNGSQTSNLLKANIPNKPNKITGYSTSLKRGNGRVEPKNTLLPVAFCFFFFRAENPKTDFHGSKTRISP